MIAHPDLSSPPSTVVPSVRMMSPSTTGFTPSPGTTVSMWAHKSSGATPSQVASRCAIRLPQLPWTFSAAPSKRQLRPALSSSRTSLRATSRSRRESESIWTNSRNNCFSRAWLTGAMMILYPDRRHPRHRAPWRADSVGGAGAGSGDQAVDFLFAEAGQQARFAGDRDGLRAARHVVDRLARAACIEQIVDAVLELLRAPQPLGVALGQLAHPLRAHPHVSNLVGQHVVDCALDNLVAVFLRDSDELIEDVAGEPLKAAVDPGHAGRRIFGLGAAPQNFGFGIVAGLGTHVFQQTHEDFAVPRFVPDLARHIELKLPRRVGKIEQRASRRLHRLQLAGKDAVQAHPQ